MTVYKIRQARRAEAKPLVGLHSESGAGKTYSALLLARGFVGPDGEICMIETEAGRGEAYVGRPLIGNYDVVPMREDFSPVEYGKAITAVEQAKKYGALIIDSASHEWEGMNGVLDQAARNKAKGSKGVLVWQQPKIDHARHFMLRVMQTPIPLVILCMRSKYPMEQTIDSKGEKQWTRAKHLEPKQADDILFEMFVHGWIDHDHKLHVGKTTVDELAAVFRDGEPISLDTGRRLARWAKDQAEGAKSSTEKPAETKAADSAADDKPPTDEKPVQQPSRAEEEHGSAIDSMMTGEDIARVERDIRDDRANGTLDEAAGKRLFAKWKARKAKLLEGDRHA